MENAEKDIMIGIIDAEGSGGLTSEDYDVKLIAGPMLLAGSIIFNVAEGLHVSVSFVLCSFYMLSAIYLLYSFDHSR